MVHGPQGERHQHGVPLCGERVQFGPHPLARAHATVSTVLAVEATILGVVLPLVAAGQDNISLWIVTTLTMAATSSSTPRMRPAS